MRFTIKELDERCKSRPQGYREEILLLSIKIDDNKYELSDEDYKKLAEKYRLPSVVKMAMNFTGATVEHLANPGQRNSEEIAVVASICSSCKEYIESEIRCAKCGCFLKRKWLWKSSKCPLEKW